MAGINNLIQKIVLPHRALNKTACPGRFFDMVELHNEIKESLVFPDLTALLLGGSIVAWDKSWRKWKGIVIHHSASRSSWEAIWKHHVLVRGWRAIGYHFGVEQVKGRWVYRQGRLLSTAGAHVKGHNKDYVGIVMIGNFEKYPPPKPGIKMLARLCARIIIRGVIEI